MRKGKFLTGGNRTQFIPAKKRVDANPSKASLGTEPVEKQDILAVFYAQKGKKAFLACSKIQCVFGILENSANFRETGNL
ncbi:hypothetical protein HYU50_00620 [Candidatus Woesearchaeota archaeon]|nr:hypothetical protein [Candidatus Woesearchaeota archaeon]